MKLFLICLIIFSSATPAALPESVIQEVDLRIKHNLNASIALGVYQKGKAEYYVRGWQNKAQQVPATTQTIYEIGSITKTFTSLLLATLVENKQVQLDDSVAQHWPKGFVLQDQAGHPVTLRHLATHTSGLPRLPGNIIPFSQDPYAQYDRDKLLQAVAATKPQQTGKQYAYSNFAVGLLGETLAQITGQSYNQLIETYILKPLELNQTFMTLTAVPEAHLAVGYNHFGETAAWNFKALAGAGSIRSSIHDLLSYGIAFTRKNPSELAQAMQLTMQTHYQKDSHQMGLGWHFNNGTWWHNGGTGGFRSIVVIDADNNRVVAGITNQANQDVEDLVAHILNPENAIRTHDFPVDITAQQLESYTGHFHHPQTENDVVLMIKNQQLLLQSKQVPEQPLVYLGKDTFKFKTTNTKLIFSRNAEQVITEVSMQGWGQPQIYQKSN